MFFKTRKRRQSCSLSERADEGHVSTWREGNCAQARKRALTRHRLFQHLACELPDSRTMRKKCLSLEPPSLWCFGIGAQADWFEHHVTGTWLLSFSQQTLWGRCYHLPLHHHQTLTFYRRENKLREVKDISSVKQLGNVLLGFEPRSEGNPSAEPMFLTTKPQECGLYQPHTATYRMFAPCQPLCEMHQSALLILTTIPEGSYHSCPHFTDEQTVGRLPSVHLSHSLTVCLWVWFAAAVGNSNQLRLLLWDLWEGKWYWEKRAYTWSLNVTETVVEFCCLYYFHPTKNSGTEWEGKGSGVKDPGRCEQWWVHLWATVSRCY